MMRIDILKTSPDRAGRYFLQFANGSIMRLYRQTIEDHGLYAGLELTDDEYKELRRSAQEMSAKMRAVRIVSAASISSSALESRLIQKGEDPIQAKQAVSWLEDLSLLDDKKTAEQIVHSCISRGYGLSRAKQAMFEKRIPRELWADALQGYPDQKEHISAFLRQRLTNAMDDREVKRATDALIRRGHNYSVIREVLSELSLDSEDFPEDC